MQLSNLAQNTETSSNSSIDKTQSLPISNLEQDIYKPLLNKSNIGNKRRNDIKTIVEVEEIVSK